ncbi:Serine-protein kinase ATM [Sciurus carolinensis]|uniref:Serine-protein kinase ATM n=1 Tax=Sciurus carolinensis TaxID=30640 RepID=A0AA41N6J4_SCICA|nr:Serine-protein kinase ATM [Sciurus carolinensis]
MSLALNDLLICCRQLEHDRATERRKEVEKFKRLIRDPETVQHLDRHSDSKQGKYLNWDAVFRFLQKYIQKETECLRTAKPNVSASTQTSRQKKMQEISSLVRYFIKCANKRAPRLKCQELLNYIMDTVKDSSNGVIYGADCSNILLKDILSVRKYWCEISQQQWLELFSVYFRLYLKPSQDINRVLVARIIHAVTKGCCSQTDGLSSKFLDFFSKAIQYARQEKSSAGLSHILAALIFFLKSLAVNFRIQVCELGDEILPTLLYVWTQHRLNDSLKEVIIELFQLQIYIHHPKGAKTQEKGAYESPKWQSILYNLYELLVNEISHIGSRGKYSAGSRNIAVKENLIELMADVCHQVFNEDTRSLEISQSYTTTQRESSDYSIPCKRRKIELGWEVIKDYLQKSQNDFDLVPWLQITTQLISKYPASLPNCEISPLLMILYQLLPQQRHGERTPYVLRCLIEVALCQGKKSNLESSQKSDLVKLWIKIWSVTFRGISSEQMQTENFGLLGAIIQGNLVEVDREFWKLFTGSVCKPSGPSVCCLTLALTNSVVPETVKKGTEQNICDVNRSFTLKESIMRWLLFYQLEDDLEDNAELPPILQSEHHQKVKEEPSFSEVEQLFLQTTFDKMDFLTVVEECAVEKYQSSIGFSVHQNLKESLDRYLLGLAEKLLNNYSFEQNPRKIVSGFFLRLLTSKLMNDIAEICKSLASFIKKPFDHGEIDSVKDDTDENLKEAKDSSSMDLLKDYPVGNVSDASDSGESQSTIGAMNPLAEELSKQDLLLLDMLKFLCMCVTASQTNTVSFRAADIRRKLLMLIDSSILDPTKSLHVHMADPYSKWAILNVMGKDFPVNEVFPQFLADDHHQVRMLAAESINRSCYKVLIPHLVIRSHFDEVKSIANQIQEDWKSLLIDCFPKILVNILPYFAYDDVGDSRMAQQRENATTVYNMLKGENLLGKQIDHLFISHLPEIVVELLMSLHETADSGASQSTGTCDFSGDLDPAPNPPYFPSHVIKATFAYISNCHKTKFKSILEILSRNPDSYQKILLAICEQAAETNNVYKKHRVLKIYHLFVSLLLKDIKSGLGGAWAFVLRDVIYTLIHYVNKRPSHFMDVSLRSFSLCCDLLGRVCQTAVTYCKDALEKHLHVIVGTLIPLVNDQVEVQEQVLNLLKYLVIDNKDNENLYLTIKLLDPFPDHVVFKDLRVTQQNIKYSRGPFSLLEEINHFLAVSDYDALPLTRLEGLKDLRRQLEQHKDQMMDLMRASQDNPQDGIVVKLVVSLLQLSKMAVNHTGEREVLALLYAEIYADKKSMDDQEKRSLTFEEGSQSTTISSLSEKSKEETGISLQDLLLEIYRSIGEPDSLYGCGGGKMLQPLTRLRTYEHEAMWEKALVTYDLETTISSATRQAGIIQALQNLGLCHILSIYLKGLDHENEEWCAELQELHYQAAWRNMQWDHYDSFNKGLEGTSYHESLYNALQSLRDREFSTFYESLRYARVKEVEELCKGSLESVYSLYPTLSRLQTIGELENIGQLFSRSLTDKQISELYIKWRKHSQLIKDSDFSFQEPIMALRTVILEILMEKEVENSQRECFKDILTKHLIEFSILARTFKNTQLPERAIFQIKQYNSAICEFSEWQLEEAQVFWAKKEQSLALNILKQMIKKLDANCAENDPNLKLIYTECLRVCGNWLAETCLENPAVIMQTYLEKAVEVAGSYDGESNELRNGKMKAFLSLARFSDTQYQRIENYMKSSEFENKQALLKRAKEEVGLLREHKIQTNRYTVKVQRELELDECALRALKEDRKRFLCKAVENYINCLLSGEEHDMWVFRLCSLWLENSGVSEVNCMMKRDGMKISSYKFLPLMYQLAARMGTKMMGGLGFHEVLNNLISRISMDHPHHTLFIILALANANKDEFLTKPEISRRSRVTKNVPKQSSQLDEDRTEAANKIICTIRSKRPQMVKNIEALCDAYIILANLDATQWKTQRKGINIPADQPITKLKNLEDVIVPTMEIKVDPTGEYGNLVTVQSFKTEFRLAGGLNLPKIIDCVGSDGKERRQLVKGRDDLRQDAVMQQVFQMCNTLLQRNTETRKRKLTICTYKVVPLSQRSGVLEWCTGTVPIGEFLVNNEDGAHKRYRPKDFSALQCQKKMMEVQKRSFEEKYEIFMDICQNFQPVFRYFCMEKFLDPAVWFEKRLAYTRSVATSSIVGYILGLGDRHVQNILINEQSAELVHIDLGVAFEQGKILPTPETVPFRLTRDIVDGMGITGVEGVFRRCCEKTMEVMRNSQETLLTIVEVLLYDPLFDWTMNPLKALYLQQRPEDETELPSTLNADDQECKRNLSDIDQSFNKVAERVLMRLQEKLKGVEEGTVLSVGGQVNLLIQQAMDPKNLSRLFPGWKAWV